jgi:hypothetical protein
MARPERETGWFTDELAPALSTTLDLLHFPQSPLALLTRLDARRVLGKRSVRPRRGTLSVFRRSIVQNADGTEQCHDPCEQWRLEIARMAIPANPDESREAGAWR